MHRFLKLVSIVALFSLGTGLGQQALRWAHVYQPLEPFHEWAVWAADEIAERTEGRYTIEVFPASSLGSESEINEGLALGIVDIIYSGAAFSSREYGPLAIAEAPFLFRDFGHWQSFVGSDIFDELALGYQSASGHEVLAATYYGQRHVTSNRPINTPEDMEGLRIRVPDSPLYLMFPRSVGASPTPIAFAEVYLALQQGVVDAQENPLPTIQARSFYEVQSHINLTAHMTNTLLTVLSQNLWNRLAEEDRAIFYEVMREAAERASADVRAQEEELVEVFENMEDVTVVHVDRGPFQEAIMPALTGPDATWSEELLERVRTLD